MADGLQGFNEAQKKAILHLNGPCLVLAGPGSGKTTVITRRLQYMTDRSHIPPQDIVVVTFTRSAASQMQIRYSTLTGSQKPVSFGTFHAIFYRILREYERDDPPKILTENEKTYILKGLLKRRAMAAKDMSVITRVFGRLRNGQSLDGDEETLGIPEAVLKDMFQEYRRICKADNKLDLDDMAYECLEVFKSDERYLRLWQRRFKYVLIDEYQDISPMQDEVMSLLALPENNIFVVGDDDQAIYGFRGAGTGIMLSFPHRYPGCEQILLDTNYRSRPGIIRAAAAVIATNKHRYEKQQIPAREPKDPGKKEAEISLTAYVTIEEEYEELIEILKELSNIHELSDTAVLYRRNSDADRLCSLLVKNKLPFKRSDRERNILDSFITRDITAYLRYFHGDNTRDNFLRIMNRPQRHISREAVSGSERVLLKAILEYHRGEKEVWEQVIRLSADRKRANSLSIYAAIMYIRRTVGYENYLKKEYKGLALEEHLQLLNILQDMSREAENLKAWERIIKGDDEGKGPGAAGAGDSGKNKAKAREDRAVEEGVNIMTYHGSKGLEYDHVILPDLNEGMVPHKRAASEEELEEERRMFYVAMTRAREDLRLMYVKGTNKDPKAESPFLKPLLES